MRRSASGSYGLPLRHCSIASVGSASLLVRRSRGMLRLRPSRLRRCPMMILRRDAIGLVRRRDGPVAKVDVDLDGVLRRDQDVWRKRALRSVSEELSQPSATLRWGARRAAPWKRPILRRLAGYQLRPLWSHRFRRSAPRRGQKSHRGARDGHR